MDSLRGRLRRRNFKNHGTTWERSPQAVNDHDFRSQADGIAIPYGVYDLGANRGFVVVGTSHDTPDFAADNLLRWWQAEGRQDYPGARELLLVGRLIGGVPGTVPGRSRENGREASGGLVRR